jgi:hypothetical protein
MKKIILSLLVGLSAYSTQAQVCVPGTLTTTANAYILPDSATNFYHGCPGTNYNQILYIKAAKDTVINITSPLTATLTAKIDSFVVDANITGLPSYLTVQSVPSTLAPAGAGSPKSNYTRLIIPGDSLACVKVSGAIPGTAIAGTNNLVINLRVYLSNIHSTDPVIDIGIPGIYTNRMTDTTTSIGYYKIVIDPTPCFPSAVSNLEKYNFDLLGNTPNPLNASTRITFLSAKADVYDLRIVDAMGEVVFTKNIKAAAGINYVNIDASAYSNGVYMYSLNNGKNILSSKMQISK